jgi:hypothetical protein
VNGRTEGPIEDARLKSDFVRRLQFSVLRLMSERFRRNRKLPKCVFTVDGRAVSASSATSFRHGPCEHLENGTWVEVNGLRQGNGTVLADKIEMKEREFTGMITSMSSGCPTLTLGINGLTVKTYGWTKFEKLACGGFVTGLRVEVKGTEHPNGIVKAIRLKYEGEN